MSSSPATDAPPFSSRGGKPYPYVLTLSGKTLTGKPLGRNPHVHPYRTGHPYSIGLLLLSIYTVLSIRPGHGLGIGLCVLCIVCLMWA